MFEDAESTRLLPSDQSSIQSISFKDMTSSQKWRFIFNQAIRPVTAEFLGQMAFAFFHCSTAHSIGNETTALRSILPAVSDGLTVAILVVIIGGISGAHVNFAVTFAVMLGGGIKPWKVPLYLIAQLLGSLSGAGLAYVVQGGPSGEFVLGKDIGPWQGFGMEVMATTMLTLVVLVAAVELSSVNAAFAIGFAILVDILAGFEVSGGCMNPTLSLGPAVFSGKWGYYWIYWAGPILGSLIAAAIFRILLADKYRITCRDDRH